MKLYNRTYTLTETETPDGYYPVEDVTIDVQNTAERIVVTARIGDEVIEYPKIEKDRNTSVWRIEITNQSGVELPSTGGFGTRTIKLLGVLLLGLTALAASVHFLLRRNEAS